MPTPALLFIQNLVLLRPFPLLLLGVIGVVRGPRAPGVPRVAQRGGPGPRLAAGAPLVVVPFPWVVGGPPRSYNPRFIALT